MIMYQIGISCNTAILQQNPCENEFSPKQQISLILLWYADFRLLLCEQFNYYHFSRTWHWFI